MALYSGFHKLTLEERIKFLMQHVGLEANEAQALLNSGSLDMQVADRWIENVVGSIHLPLGLATNFKINGHELMVPMAIEEPSVVAAACRAAKQTLPDGFKADADDPVMIGQIQLIDVPDIKSAIKKIETNKKEILGVADTFVSSHLGKFGGGVRDLAIKVVTTNRQKLLVIEFYVDVRDAMGANMINTLLEGITPTIVGYTGGKNRLRIISNLATKRKVRASAIWKKEVVGEEIIDGVLDAYEFANADIYRCCTHNKGIMNGIDAVVLATGNDWRAVEAGAHAYASIKGYHSLTTYKKTEKGDLEGSIELPLAVATVGGAVNTSPTAKIALKIMGVKTSQELAMVCACVGLANNFAALSALATVGIQQGHMKLHARNVAIRAGAESTEEIDLVAAKLSEEKDFTTDKARSILERFRKGGS